MAQAKCLECGMIYTFEGDEISSVTKCVCQSRTFQTIAAM